MLEPMNADQATACAEAMSALRAAPRQPVPDQALEPFLGYAWALVRGALRDDEFVGNAAPYVDAARSALVEYMLSLDELLTTTFYGDEWIAACERRSRLQAACSLWAEELGGPGAPHLDCETVDDLLRQKGDHEGGLRPEQIPPGTPTSHWWWWYPAPPPA
jgi:hypothetical protein